METYVRGNRIRSLITLSECFYDFRVLFEFISLLKILVSIEKFKRHL